MNAPVDKSSFDRNPAVTEEFFRLRSECVDAFATLETAFYRLAAILKIETDSKGQLSQLIKKLKAAQASLQLSKENASKLKACCDEAGSLLGQRADIVHSRMIIAQDGTQFFAIFRNAVAVSSGVCDASAYDLQMLKEVAQKATQIGGRIDGLRNHPHPKSTSS